MIRPLQARRLQSEPLRGVAERVNRRGHTVRGRVSRIDPGRPAVPSFSLCSRLIQHALRPTPGSFALPGDGWRIAGPVFAGSPTPVTD